MEELLRTVVGVEQRMVEEVLMEEVVVEEEVRMEAAAVVATEEGHLGTVVEDLVALVWERISSRLTSETLN